MNSEDGQEQPWRRFEDVDRIVIDRTAEAARRALGPDAPVVLVLPADVARALRDRLAVALRLDGDDGGDR